MKIKNIGDEYCLTITAVKVLQDEHRIKQRTSAHIPFQIKLINQFIKRIILIFVCLERSLFDLIQIRNECQIGLRVIS